MNKSHFVVFVLFVLSVSLLHYQLKLTNKNLAANATKLPDQQMDKNPENDKSMATLKEKDQATSCRDYPNSNGIETIRVPGMDAFEVLCNSESYGDGWTVIMRRYSYSDMFYTTWNEYKNGFGNLSTQFWIGLDKLHLMTKYQSHELQLDYGDYHKALLDVTFSNFSIANEAESYKVLTSESESFFVYYSAFLKTKTGVKFTTIDLDNDNDTANCAKRIGFGWWFNTCHPSQYSLFWSPSLRVMIRPTSN